VVTVLKLVILYTMLSFSLLLGGVGKICLLDVAIPDMRILLFSKM
jgi:hypothetical protein